MSCYDDIYNDFPLRCATVWEEFNDAAKAEKLDVTFMLMCAAGGFVTPWEHLKIPEGLSKDNEGHPAFLNYDESKYGASLLAINSALMGEISSSPLFRHMQMDHCFYGHANTIDLIKGMAESRQPSNLFLSAQRPRQIVKALRNAIAHNNIYAFARYQSKVISDLTFFSEVLERNGSNVKIITHYEVIVMSVSNFRSFLTAWFALLRIASRRGKYIKLVVSNALENDDQQIASHG